METTLRRLQLLLPTAIAYIEDTHEDNHRHPIIFYNLQYSSLPRANHEPTRSSFQPSGTQRDNTVSL